MSWMFWRELNQPETFMNRMPSTHSATIACYATYVPLACLYHSYNSPTAARTSWRASLTLVVVPAATLVAASRVWLGYHTWQQVAAGTTFGVVFATLWFTLWTNGVDKLLEESLDTLSQVIFS